MFILFPLQDLGSNCLGEATEFSGVPGKGLRCCVTNIDVSNISIQQSHLKVEVAHVAVDNVNIQTPSSE